MTERKSLHVAVSLKGKEKDLFMFGDMRPEELRRRL